MLKERPTRRCGGRENKWNENKKEILEKRADDQTELWMKKKGSEWGESKKEWLQEKWRVLQECSPGLFEKYECISTISGCNGNLYGFHFSWHFLFFNEIIFIFSVRIEVNNNKMNIPKSFFEHQCPF